MRRNSRTTDGPYSMNKVISAKLWKELARLSKRAIHRRVAVAYVTKDALGPKRDDSLVVDASDQAVKSGQTSAKVLAVLRRRGVNLFSYPGLHAKVMSFGNAAIIGSANMSDSSENSLVEAALASDSPSIIASVESLVYQLQKRATLLSSELIAHLASIKVDKRPWPQFETKSRNHIEVGNLTWILGVHELADDAYPNEAAVAASGTTHAEKKKSLRTSTVNWIRWNGKDRVRRDLRQGDNITEIWRPKGRKIPSRVYRNAAVLLRHQERTCSRFYIEERPRYERDSMDWSGFKTMLKRIVFCGKVGARSGRLIESDWAELIHKNWKKR